MVFEYGPLLTGLIGFLPGLVVLMAAYSRFDGHFRDQTIFLFYMGGLLAGVLLGYFHVALVGMPYVFFIGVALVQQSLMTAVINWKKWQGTPQAVFNGGAFGLGLATLVAFVYTHRMLTLPGSGAPGVVDYGLATALSFALALAGMAAGAAVGVGVRDRTPFKSLAISALVYMPFLILVGSFFVEYVIGTNSSWFWLLPALAYGALAAVYATTKLLPLGLTVEGERAMRRAARKTKDA